MSAATRPGPHRPSPDGRVGTPPLTDRPGLGPWPGILALTIILAVAAYAAALITGTWLGVAATLAWPTLIIAFMLAVKATGADTASQMSKIARDAAREDH